MFSNTFIIIDEAQNIKEGNNDSLKVLPPILDKIVTIAENLKLLLLSATPMFDNSTEIIWLLNLLLKNDNRPPLKMSTFFDTDGNLKLESIDLFKTKIKGYISYIRGENHRFPKIVSNNFSNIITPEK